MSILRSATTGDGARAASPRLARGRDTDYSRKPNHPSTDFGKEYPLPMFRSRPGESHGLFKSVMVAYAVLVLHVLLLAGLGLLVIFFRGVTQYMLWIFLFGAAAVSISGYLFYRRMKAEGKTLREVLHSPTFGGRPVEVSFLGGMATFRLGGRSGPLQLPDRSQNSNLQLEDADALRERELETLLRLLEKNHITPEEYQKAKKDILQ